jgi:hypothetical protein
MRFLLIFLISLNISFSFGQEVRLIGRCIDKSGDPIEFVTVSCEKAKIKQVSTNEKGIFELIVPTEEQVEIKFKINEFEEIRSFKTLTKPYYTIDNVKFNYSQIKIITITAEKSDPFEIPKLTPIDLQTIPMGSVERSLIYTTTASSNNELTSNYNVRGGNYDENLVYVNGFNINRPFLTRSGQQEGMSFINSALVKDIRFSGGGFDAQYGDKLSSILDITYKTPDNLKGSAMASIMGLETHLENKIGSRFDYLIGARYRNNGYLLNSLPTKGSYNPIFMDAQFLTNFHINERLKWSLIGHFSSNKYRFSPQTSETDFGVANEAYRFKIYFDGQENTYFQTFTGGTSLKWDVSKKTKLDLYATVFNSNEREKYDIQGQYFINQLETDPSKEKYGDSIAVLGVGTFLNHARNELNATIISVYHNGEHIFKKGFRDSLKTKYDNQKLMWGVNVQRDLFNDVLSEWKVLDSAGYNLPQSTGDEIRLFQTIKSDLNLKTFRATSFLQMNSIWSKVQRNKIVKVSKKSLDSTKTKITTIYTDTIKESSTRLAFNYGLRVGYTQVNNDFYLTPRIGITYFPRIYMVEKGRIVRRDVRLRFSSGLYYQPPIYREFRTNEGKLNTDVKSQKSAHFVAGTDIYFNMWDRESPFKFTAEAYYKYLWDVNLYQIDNVRTIYYANNNATAYAYGLDLNIHGQFIKGIESFFKIGLLNTKEKLSTDSYYKYYNKDGELIQPLVTVNQIPTDSVKIEPKYIPRPTDQLLNFGALIQDKMPGYESISVQMGVQFGTPLPYGPPNMKHYQDTLRYKQSYFRVDLGMSYDLLYKQKNNFKTIRKYFSDAIISLEVFNLLGFNNILSKQWIQDVNGRYYSIPNYLTQRRVNLKMIVRF